jgi:hypothetical protein
MVFALVAGLVAIIATLVAHSFIRSQGCPDIPRSPLRLCGDNRYNSSLVIEGP